MTRGRAGTFRKSRDWDELGCGYSAATADPFASVGMTRGERVLFGRVATWMDGIQCGYSAATADPFASVRDDKGGAGTFRKSRDWDGLGGGDSAATADPFASVGMTRGERRLRLKLLLEGETHTAAEAVPLEEKSARSGT